MSEVIVNLLPVTEAEKLEFEAYRIQVERQLRVLYILFFIILVFVLTSIKV